MTDLWTEATRDPAAERLIEALDAAGSALASKFAFVIEATDRASYEDRKALVADHVERIITAATGGDPALFAVAHEATLTQWDADFERIQAHRADREAALRAPRHGRRRAARVARKLAWTTEQVSVNTYPGLSEKITVDTINHAGGDAQVFWMPTGQWAWVATGRDGVEGSGDSGSKAEAQGAAIGFLNDHDQIDGQMSLIAKVHDGLVPGKWYVADRAGAISSGPHDTAESASRMRALGPEFARVFQADDTGMGDAGGNPRAQVYYSSKMSARTLPNVTDAEIKRFIELAAKYGYIIDPAAAHDLLLMNGGFEKAMESSRTWADVWGSGGDLSEGGVSMLIETTDPTAWYYRSEGDWDHVPDPSDFDVLIPKLRHPGNREQAQRSKELIQRQGSKRQLRHIAATQSEVDALVASFPESVRGRAAALGVYAVYGPGYNRNVAENLWTAARMAGHGAVAADDMEWYLRKAEAQVHYAETGEWVAPIHPRETGRQQTLDGGEQPYGFNSNVYEGARKTAVGPLGQERIAYDSGEEDRLSDLADDISREGYDDEVQDDWDGVVVNTQGESPDPYWFMESKLRAARAVSAGEVFSAVIRPGVAVTALRHEGAFHWAVTDEAGDEEKDSGSSSTVRDALEQAWDALNKVLEKEPPPPSDVASKVEDAADQVETAVQSAGGEAPDAGDGTEADDSDDGSTKPDTTDDGTEPSAEEAADDDAAPSTKDDEAADSPQDQTGPAEEDGDEASSDAVPPDSGEEGAGTANSPESVVDQAESISDGDMVNLDPTTMTVGQKVNMTYTLNDGTTGNVDVTFIREDNDIYFFDGPAGEFGIGDRDGTWVDSEGNQFAFSDGDAMEEVTGEDIPDDSSVVDIDLDADLDDPAEEAEAADDEADEADGEADDEEEFEKIKQSMLIENPRLSPERAERLARRVMTVAKAIR